MFFATRGSSHVLLITATAAYARGPGPRSKHRATPPPQCVLSAENGSARKSVHTHQHIRRAVNRMQDGERGTQREFVSYPLTATVYILYCSITHVCHTCCLYDYLTLFTYCTHKEMMFCNCLYLTMFFPVAMSLCGCVSQMQQGKPDVPLPSLCF